MHTLETQNLPSKDETLKPSTRDLNSPFQFNGTPTGTGLRV